MQDLTEDQLGQQCLIERAQIRAWFAEAIARVRAWEPKPWRR